MMQVCKIAWEEELPSVKKQALEELKEKMWSDVWKDMVDLPEAKVVVHSLGDGLYKVTAKV